MRRRSFLKGLLGSAVVLALPAVAEEPRTVRRYHRLKTSTTPLTEGVVPTHDSLTYDEVPFSRADYNRLFNGSNRSGKTDALLWDFVHGAGGGR